MTCIWTKRRALARIREGAWRVVCSNQMKSVTIPQINVSKIGFANPRCILQDCCKHWLKVTWRATNNLEHLRRSRLLL